MIARAIVTSLILISVGLLSAEPATAEEGWIDVHFHVVGNKGEKGGYVEAAGRALEIMEESGIAKIIVMSPPRPVRSVDMNELIGIQEKYGSKISIMGGGGTLNPMIQKAGHSTDLSAALEKQFEATAENILASGAKGFGEITAHHVSLTPNHAYESVPADHPLLLLLADIAARHDVPIDLHFDPIPKDIETPPALTSPRNPATLKENISGFERLLSHNRKAKIVWAHAGSDVVGFYTPDLVRRLLNRHPNLYCSVRTTLRRNNAMRHPKRGINKAWIEVLAEFPDRFVMGTDSFVVTRGYTGPDGPRRFEQRSWIQRNGANEVLSYVDRALARKIGRDNAIRIYKLPD